MNMVVMRVNNMNDEQTVYERFPHVKIGKNVTIGKNVKIGNNVELCDNVKIGNGVKIRDNIKIGEGIEVLGVDEQRLRRRRRV